MLTGDKTIESSNGAHMLTWEAGSVEAGSVEAGSVEAGSVANQVFEVEHARDESFDDARVVYRGRMNSAHVSGLPNGRHLFRVRSQPISSESDLASSHLASSNGPAWSDPQTLVVTHHPMGFVWLMFSLGALTFVTTAGVVLWNTGARAS